MRGSTLTTTDLAALGWTVSLTVEKPEEEFFRVFDGYGAGAPAILDAVNGDDDGAVKKVEIGFAGSADHTFGIEASRFRGYADTAGTLPDLSDDVHVDRAEISLVVEDGSNAIVAYDRVVVGLAPFLLLSNVGRVETLHLEDERRDRGNDAFIDAINTALATDALPAAEEADVDDQWPQDQAEIGYSQAPGASSVPTILNLPRDKGMRQFFDGLVAVDYAVFEIPDFTAANSANFGGNIEVSPPVSGHDFGRIFVGDNVADELLSFLEAQKYQEPFQLSVSWLSVGHVDEVTNIIPDGDSPDHPDFKVIVADPALARTLLESGHGSIQAPARHRAVFATGAEAHGTATDPRPDRSLRHGFRPRAPLPRVQPERPRQLGDPRRDPWTIDGVLTFYVDSMAFESRDGVFLVRLNGEVEPLFFSAATGVEPAAGEDALIPVNGLTVTSEGDVALEGGWITLPAKKLSIGLLAVNMTVNGRVVVGATDDPAGGPFKFFYIDLENQFPAGAPLPGREDPGVAPYHGRAPVAGPGQRLLHDRSDGPGLRRQDARRANSSSCRSSTRTKTR